MSVEAKFVSIELGAPYLHFTLEGTDGSQARFRYPARTQHEFFQKACELTGLSRIRDTDELLDIWFVLEQHSP